MVQVPGTTLELGVEHEYYDVHWNLAENDEEGVEQNALFQLRQTQRRGKIPQLQLMIDENLLEPLDLVFEQLSLVK